MMVIQAPKRAQTLPGLSLSLYEQLAHIPRDPEAIFPDYLTSKSDIPLLPLLDETSL